MQNWDFFGTKFGLWSHLGPSPKFGTSLEGLKNTFECIYNLGDLYKKLSGWARLSPTATPSTGIGCIIIKAALSFVHFVINENHDFK